MKTSQSYIIAQTSANYQLVIDAFDDGISWAVTGMTIIGAFLLTAALIAYAIHRS